MKHYLLLISLGIVSCASQSVMNGENNTISSIEYQRIGLEKSANQGKINAQITLGDLYENGTFGTDNKFKAVEWFRKAAKQGDKKIQWKLGLMYLHGEYLPKDNQEAINWLTKSADQNYRMAQLALAFMYRDGKDIPKNKIKAEQYYKMACSDINFSNMALPHPDTVPGQCLIFNDFKNFKIF